MKPPKEPKEGEEEDEEVNEEDLIELPEFTKTLSMRSVASKERTKSTPLNGEKVQEVKASDATTAV